VLNYLKSIDVALIEQDIPSEFGTPFKRFVLEVGLAGIFQSKLQSKSRLSPRLCLLFKPICHLLFAITG